MVEISIFETGDKATNMMSMDAPQLVHGTYFFVALLSDFSFQLSFETANSGMKHLVIYQHTMVHHITPPKFGI